MGLFSTTPQWQRALANWRGIKDVPAAENRKHLKGIRVLESDFLENYFATAHWTLPGVWSLPLVAYFSELAVAPPESGQAATLIFTLLGLAGTAAALVLFDAVWRKRFRAVREPLVRGLSMQQKG